MYHQSWFRTYYMHTAYTTQHQHKQKTTNECSSEWEERKQGINVITRMHLPYTDRRQNMNMREKINGKIHVAAGKKWISIIWNLSLTKQPSSQTLKTSDNKIMQYKIRMHFNGKYVNIKNIRTAITYRLCIKKNKIDETISIILMIHILMQLFVGSAALWHVKLTIINVYEYQRFDGVVFQLVIEVWSQSANWAHQ